MTRRPSALHGRDNLPVWKEIIKQEAEHRREPWSWYGLDETGEASGHEAAHLDGPCDCDEPPLATGGVERS